MMNFIFLLGLYAVSANAATEGDYCVKEGIAGVCTNIRKCSDAQEDIRNRRQPQICEFRGLDPTVCCPSADSIPERPQKGCVLPPYPDHGTYVTNVPNSSPGDAYEAIAINVTCLQGYDVTGYSRAVFCLSGLWSEQMPKCVRVCRLTPHPSVEYNCLVDDGGVTGSRPCKEYEPHGTVVSPRCQTPNYYSPTSLKFMKCIDGYWDYIARCNPECGTVKPDEVQLILGGQAAKRGEIPWHAIIYTKTEQPFKQICGGSLISTNIIISAAHCFWSNVDGALPESEFAVAVGKLYQSWKTPVDEKDAQYSEVKAIHIPKRFQGIKANYQDDIAVVIVSKPFQFNTYVRPVCIDFDDLFDRQQLQPGKTGKTAGWDNGKEIQMLTVIDMPYTSIETCISDSQAHFRQYITSDKFCAGEIDGSTTLCRGDARGGLSFPESERGTLRYYLRGVFSVALANEDGCNINNYTTFTHVMKHEHFIKQFLETN